MIKSNLIQSFYYATKGILNTVIKERNLKIQITIGLFAVVLSIILKISKIYFIIIILVSFLVIILEFLNAAIEKLIDIISPTYNGEFGKIKDTMAGTVLMSAILSVIIGVLILYTPLINALRLNQNIFLVIILSFSIIVIFGYIIKHLQN